MPGCNVTNPAIDYTVYRGQAGANGSVAKLPAVNLEVATEGTVTVRQWQFDLGGKQD